MEDDGVFLCLFGGCYFVVISVFLLILGVAFDVMLYAVFMCTLCFVTAVLCFVTAYRLKCREIKGIEEKRVSVEDNRRHIIEVWRFYTGLFEKESA